MSKFAKRISVMEEEVKKLKVLSDSLVNPDIISFAGGAPGKEAYPFEKLREISQDVFKEGDIGYEALKYGSTIGYEELRVQIKDKLLANRGVETEIENIMVTAGGIQPMNLLSQLYLDPGDYILVETPSFVHTSMIYKMFEANLIPCSMDDEGLVIEDVEEKIKKYNPKFIYTVPTFQNPTGVTMSLERRKKLAELAAKYDVIVIEDDPYREIRYSGETLPYIKSFDNTGHVILTNSMSKIFSPGSRLGYLVADKEIINKLCNIKLGTDTCTNTVTQVLCAEFFKRGYYADHLVNLCNLYRVRRDAMLNAIDESFPEGTKHTIPDGGYYTWIELPNGMDASSMKAEIAEKLNICYGDGSIFFTEGNLEKAGCN
ncbi:PLP-dependent aminotransferase family protein, partial [Intestinibacter sp.]|uniref:aminotransferase-like domain-containing protein n=1 Tax=Intestinibacter sp. TaxID=1965304 RepID=UPI003F158A2B